MSGGEKCPRICYSRTFQGYSVQIHTLVQEMTKNKVTSFWMPKNISFLKSLQMSSGGKVSCLLPIRLGFCWKHTPIPKKEICKILQLELFLRGAKIIQLLLAMADFCGRVLKKSVEITITINPRKEPTSTRKGAITRKGIKICFNCPLFLSYSYRRDLLFSVLPLCEDRRQVETV